MDGNINLKFFAFLVLFLKFSWAADSNPQLDRELEVDYYEHLITAGLDEANHYQPPTDNEQYRPNQNLIPNEFGVWDFIVVGSGCGGAVVANRLSEVKNWKILLIEAGGPETNFSIIPAMHVSLHLSKFNWGYYSTEQKTVCLGMRGNRCPVVKGRALGGTTAINYEAYVRGNKADYDRWANQQNNPGWTFDEVLPYFIKSENSEVNGDSGYHGKGGYWNVKYSKPLSQQSLGLIEGSRIVHNFTGTDFNGRDQLGMFQMQLNNIREFRDSTNNAFLTPIRKRKNIKIITNAYVSKVLINRFNNYAEGVQFSKDGILYKASARVEVILAAGVINTPQILMLSGIGPKKHLEEMNIPLIKDLPVGKTLYDHSLFYGAYIGTNFSEPDLTLRQQIVQFLNNYGPLTRYSDIQTIGFYQNKSETNSTVPNLELAVSLIDKPSDLEPFFVRDLRLTNESHQAIINSLHYKGIINPFLIVLNPQSVGSVTLKSNDPYQHPNIDTNNLAELHDIEVLYQGIQTLQEIVATEPLRKINATLIAVDYPQCRSHVLGSKDYWFCALRQLTGPCYHHTGTCRMGRNHSTSVVNKKGMVHGFNNLRIVDASIFPSMIAGHTAAPTVMVAEKISDLIKLRHKVPIQPITNVIN